MILKFRFVSLATIVSFCLISIAPVTAHQQSKSSTKYVKPSIYDGLFYIVSDSAMPGRALVLSYEDQPIGPKANDPDAPTQPGFYPSPDKRYEFARVTVIRKKVYFKTRVIDGVNYLFSGVSGQAPIPGFDPSIPVPFIRGALVTLKNGKRVKSERVKFGHAVIA